MTELWNTTPRTVEEATTSLIAVKFYEALFGEAPPAEQSIILTNDLMYDILRRIKKLEERDV